MNCSYVSEITMQLNNAFESLGGFLFVPKALNAEMQVLFAEEGQ